MRQGAVQEAACLFPFVPKRALGALGIAVLHPYGMTPCGLAAWPTAPLCFCLHAPQHQLSITATTLSPEEQAFISTLNEVRVGTAPGEVRTAGPQRRPRHHAPPLRCFFMGQEYALQAWWCYPKGQLRYAVACKDPRCAAQCPQDLARFNRFFIEKEEEAVIRLQVRTHRPTGPLCPLLSARCLAADTHSTGHEMVFTERPPPRCC